MNRPLVVIAGPTAVGKSDLSIKLAKEIGGEIISADSMQVYKYMDIGTAKVTEEEMEGVKHYIIDELMPDEEFNVVRFQQLAKNAMNRIYENGHIPILVGGTGFYIQALIYDIDFTENDGDTQYRGELEKLGQEKGAEYLHDMLKSVDERSAEEIHANNVKKVIRALEFYNQTGIPISKHNMEQQEKRSPYNYAYFVLNDDREMVYERINKRIDVMIEKGLISEVEKLKDMGYDKSLVSMQGLGYKEILAFLDGDITLEEAVYILKRDTRHFAKRQITWFKRENDVIWLNVSEFDHSKDKIVTEIVKVLTERNMINE